MVDFRSFRMPLEQTKKLNFEWCRWEINLFANIISYSKQLLTAKLIPHACRSLHSYKCSQNDAEKMKNYWRILSDKKNMESFFCCVSCFDGEGTEKHVLNEMGRMKVEREMKKESRSQKLNQTKPDQTERN